MTRVNSRHDKCFSPKFRNVILLLQNAGYASVDAYDTNIRSTLIIESM